MEILPVLDMQELQKKANEFAMEGATESLKEFYSGYSSPFRKALDEKLKSVGVGNHSLDLPDMIALMNDSMSKEIDLLANEALSKTFLPLMKQFLTRVESEMTMTQFLTEFVEATDSKDIDDVSISFEKHHEYSWYEVKLSCEDYEYKMTLHEDYGSKNIPGSPRRLKLLQIPHLIEKSTKTKYSSYSYDKPRMMKLTQGNVTLELPFTQDVLRDSFQSLCARMIICGTVITIDTEEFSEDMFPDQCHCH